MIISHEHRFIFLKTALRTVVDDLRHRRAFVNHMDAERIRERVGRRRRDSYFTYEQLEDDLTGVLGHVGISAPLVLSHEMAALRPSEPDVDVRYTPELDQRVARVFARELQHLDYEDRSRRPPAANP